MLKTLSIIFVIFFIEDALSQAIMAGQCPDVKPLKDFDYNTINAAWLKRAQFPGQNLLLNNTKCIKTKFTAVENDITIDDFGLSLATGEEMTPVFDVKALGGGSMYFPLGIGPVDAKNTYIISIDPKKYMSIFICVNLNPQMHARLAYVFTINKEESKETMAKAFAPFADLDLYRDAFTPVDQTDCPYDTEKKSSFKFGSLGSLLSGHITIG